MREHGGVQGDRRCLQCAIATGERLFTKYDFKRLLQAGGVDIIQPDLSHAGGLTEVKKIASMAEAYDVALLLTARWAQSLWPAA